MAEKPLQKIRKEGDYLGGLFYQQKLLKFGLRALFDLLITLSVSFLAFRMLMRQGLAQDCFQGCLAPDAGQLCCTASLNFFTLVFAAMLVGYAVSAVLVVNTQEKLFLRSSILTALSVVSLLFVGLYYGAALKLLLLLVPVIFLSMFAGYRTALMIRRARRRVASEVKN